MMIVDPHAAEKISFYSVACPVVYPPAVESVSVYDCFWYIDPSNDDKYPFMYQITDITEATGCASCRRILLATTTEYERGSEGDEREGGGEGGGRGEVVRRNRAYR